MTHRVHPAMNAVQTLRLHATCSAPLAYACPSELLVRDHAVLAGGDAGDHRICVLSGAFPTHVGR